MFISFTCLFCSYICSCYCKCYCFLHKYVSTVPLILIWLSVLYIPRVSLIISTHFLILNLDGWEISFLNKFILFWDFIIILLYQPYLINNLQTFLAMYLSYGISIDFFLVCEGVFGLHCNALLESLSSYNFTTAPFDAVLNESLGDCFAWSRNFWLYLLLNFLSSLC